MYIEDEVMQMLTEKELHATPNPLGSLDIEYNWTEADVIRFSVYSGDSKKLKAIGKCTGPNGDVQITAEGDTVDELKENLEQEFEANEMHVYDISYKDELPPSYHESGISTDRMIEDLIQMSKENFAEVIQDTPYETEIDGIETSEIYGNNLKDTIKTTVYQMKNALGITEMKSESEDDEQEDLSESDVVDKLMGVLWEADDNPDIDFTVDSMQTFQRAYVVTNDKGFVLGIGGKQFYITVQEG